MNQEGIFKPALIAGVLLGILSALPVLNAFNCVCCAWVIAGGVFAARLFVQSSPVMVTLGQGVILGLLTGAIGAVVDTLFAIPLHLLMTGIGIGAAQQMQQALEQIPSLPPEAKETLRSIFASGGGLGVVFWIISGFMNLVIFSIVGMLGGALGVALFEKRKPGSGVTAADAYQPPPVPPPSQ